jgi:hypothetical protein
MKAALILGESFYGMVGSEVRPSGCYWIENEIIYFNSNPEGEASTSFNGGPLCDITSTLWY